MKSRRSEMRQIRIRIRIRIKPQTNISKPLLHLSSKPIIPHTPNPTIPFKNRTPKYNQKKIQF